MKITLASLVLLLAVLAGCGEKVTASAMPGLPPMTISSATAAYLDHGAIEVLPGTVKAATAATLMARVPGLIGSIAATPGTQVATGTVLVELDALEIAAKRDQAKAIAAQAAADFERARNLFDKAVLTKAEFDAAQARAAGTAAAAAEAEVMVGYTRLKAPFAGVVVRKHAEVGDLLAPGRPVIDLEDPASLRLEVEIPESLAAGVAVGTRLRVQVGDLDQPATVAEVTPASDPVSRSVLVKLALPAEARGLRSGQFGRVSLPVGGDRLLAVPAAAVLRRGQLDLVFVLADGRARLRLVRLGGAEGDLVAVRAGLSAGEMVAVSGLETLADGQPVTLR